MARPVDWRRVATTGAVRRWHSKSGDVSWMGGFSHDEVPSPTVHIHGRNKNPMSEISVAYSLYTFLAFLGQSVPLFCHFSLF